MSDSHAGSNDASEDQMPLAAAVQSGLIDPKRRRFTTAGIAASGAVLTLASRPVLGAGLCTPGAGLTISGWTSGNLSANHKPIPALGKSPGYWKHDGRIWPNDTNKLANFITLFPTYRGDKNADLRHPVAMKQGTSPRMATLIDVISAEVLNDVFARSLVCAYLNYYNGSPAKPTPEDLLAMAGRSFMPPGATTAWSEDEIVCFLSQTFEGANT